MLLTCCIPEPSLKHSGPGLELDFKACVRITRSQRLFTLIGSNLQSGMPSRMTD